MLDLNDAHGLDDAVLAVVGRAAELVRLQQGTRMGIVSRSASIRSLVHDYGLDDDVVLYDTLKDALNID